MSFAAGVTLLIYREVAYLAATRFGVAEQSYTGTSSLDDFGYPAVLFAQNEETGKKSHEIYLRMKISEVRFSPSYCL